jgi:hypothetical protein
MVWMSGDFDECVGAPMSSEICINGRSDSVLQMRAPFAPASTDRQGLMRDVVGTDQ